MAEKPRIQDAGRAAGLRTSRNQGQAQSVDAGPATGTEAGQKDATPGQLVRDDRGNISWEWSDDPELQADDILGNTTRLSALAPKELMIEDESNDLAALNNDPLPSSKKPPPGYNPYDRAEPTKQSRKKKRDLREFSKWIELKKRMRDKPGEG
jgi:hypothetical protein